MYMIIDEKTKHAAIVDPVEPEKVMNAVKEENIKLTHILTTHHHWCDAYFQLLLVNIIILLILFIIYLLTQILLEFFQLLPC